MPKDSTNIGIKIKKIRDNYNLSQDRFGKKLGLSGKTISAYETGRTCPPLKIVERIVNNYNTPFINIREDEKTKLQMKLESLQKEIIDIKEMIEGSLSL